MDNTEIIVVNDTEPPVVQIINPVAGDVSGNVTITVNASDNSNTSDIALSIYINDGLLATGTGSTLSANWSTRSKSITAGEYIIKAVAKDAADNIASTSVSVNVNKTKGKEQRQRK